MSNPPGFGTVILDQFALDAERHTLEGAEFGFRVGCNLFGGVGEAEGQQQTARKNSIKKGLGRQSRRHIR